MKTPTGSQLRAVLAVSQHLHFGQAADALDTSQPALSAQISSLERLLNARLVERTTRRVLMTAAGEEVARRAASLVADLDGLVASVALPEEPLTGRKHLGVIPTIAPYLLPPLLAKMRSDYPQLQLILHEEQTEALIASLRAGRIDIGLLALPSEAPDFDELEIAEEPFQLVVPRRHELATKAQVTQAEIAGHDVLLLDDGHCLRNQALAVCDRAGATEVPSIRANSISTLVQMVANGIGITLLPEMAVKPELYKVDDVVAIPFTGRPPSRTLGLAVRRSSVLHGDAEALRPLCRELLGVA